ncbi:uncharacterized protein LOC143637446 [Bidens hawaiensis]|uniref:uncharacterized protein LOC143637446 n=1 Tax=Bidens hawaiensis TaxID=980011 RepID=UPI00404B5041
MGDQLNDTLISKLVASDPLYLHATLQVKNKIGFIDGTCARSTTNDILVIQWDRCNSIVLTWLLNSVSEELCLGQVYSKMATKVWKDLKDTYDKVDGSVVLNLYQKINMFSQNDSGYESVGTNLLIKDELPTVQDNFAIISREESHRNFANNFVKGQTQGFGFVSKSNQSFENKKGPNRNPNVNVKCTHCNKLGHSVERCFEIVGYPSWMKPRNNPGKRAVISNNVFSDSSVSILKVIMYQVLLVLGFFFENCKEKPVFCFTSSKRLGSKLGWVVDSGANQHMVLSDCDMINQLDVSDLNIRVKHPNGTSAMVTKTSNIKLNDKVTLCDVFVVLDYCVNLISVHKLARDSKLTVSFNETNCYIHDSLTTSVLVTGNQLDGLYVCGSSSVSDKVCYGSFSSVNLWHARLGHPSDVVLNVLKDTLKLGKVVNDTPCEVCHKAKQHREPFPLSDHDTFFCVECTVLNKTDKFSSNAEKCVLIDNVVFENKNFNNVEITSLNSFDLYDDNVPKQSVNDSIPNGENQNSEPFAHRSEQSGSRLDSTIDCQQPNSSSSEPRRAYDVGRRNELDDSFEGANVEQVIPTVPRRSTRNITFPITFEYYVVEGKVKYGLERVVNYSKLFGPNMCFAAVLTKSSEPKNYFEAYSDSNWITAMNNEIEDLHRNNTWELVDLPSNRKTIRCKWIYKIKYKATGEIERYKARLVAKGYSQKEGVDFFETFSPVVKKYCLDLLAEYGMTGCKPVSNPIEQHFIITAMCKKDDIILQNVVGYQKLYMHKPSNSHLKIAIRLLRCLKGSPGKGILFSKSQMFELRAYADSDWAKCLETRKSVTGYRVFMENSLVSRKSKKQDTVSRSSVEVEYRAMCAATCEVVWIVNLLRELQVKTSLHVNLFCDNTAAISIAENPVIHNRTKHFELDLFFKRKNFKRVD